MDVLHWLAFIGPMMAGVFWLYRIWDGLAVVSAQLDMVLDRQPRPFFTAVECPACGAERNEPCGEGLPCPERFNAAVEHFEGDTIPDASK